MATQRRRSRPGFVWPGGESDDAGGPTRAFTRWQRLRFWWHRQTAQLVEDLAVEEGRDGRQGWALPAVVVVPMALVLVLVVRESDNHLAAICLSWGVVAVACSLLVGVIERRLVNRLWLQLTSPALYAAIVSMMLWSLLTLEHPRMHAHWIVFFFYLLPIGVASLSGDPRRPLFAGLYAAVGYVAVVSLFEAELARSPSATMLALAPEFEWLSHSVKMALIGAATYLGVESARRGQAVRRLSLRDGLTGLLNRRAFDQCIVYLGRRAETRNEAVTLAMVDIDHFKQLNDRHGHAVGDAVLRWVASSLRRSFRTTDLVARFGGEEFVVGFVGSAELAALAHRLEDFRLQIERTALDWLDTEEEIRVTVSAGVANVPADGRAMEDVLQCADERLYEAKEAGRNRIVCGHALPSLQGA